MQIHTVTDAGTRHGGRTTRRAGSVAARNAKSSWTIMLSTFANSFWSLCRLRGSPSSLPAAPAFAGFVVVLAIVVSLAASLLLNELQGPDRAISLLVIAAGTLLTAASMAVGIALILAANNLLPRFNQTLAAIFGVDLVLTILLAVLLTLSISLNAGAIANAAALAYFAWWIAAVGNALRQAMDASMLLGCLSAFALYWITRLITLLFTGSA